jgi:hypothetical protein
MTINLQTGGYVAPQPLPGARSADIQVGQKQVQQDTGIPAQGSGPNAAAGVDSSEEKRYQQVVNAAAGVDSSEEKRYQQVVNAAKNFFKDTYVVSDTSFAIFKDASGQYITRYTSLRDGRVTYIPEQRLLQAFENTQRQSQAVLQIQA